jgi:hypothetical protein
MSQCKNRSFILQGKMFLLCSSTLAFKYSNLQSNAGTWNPYYDMHGNVEGRWGLGSGPACSRRPTKRKYTTTLRRLFHVDGSIVFETEAGTERSFRVRIGGSISSRAAIAEGRDQSRGGGNGWKVLQSSFDTGRIGQSLGWFSPLFVEESLSTTPRLSFSEAPAQWWE